MLSQLEGDGLRTGQVVVYCNGNLDLVTLGELDREVNIYEEVLEYPDRTGCGAKVALG